MRARLAPSERNSPSMKNVSRKKSVSRWLRSASVAFSSSLILASAAFAQVGGQSPWENAVSVLQQAFTSTIARGLSLVAIVVARLTFAFGEGASKCVLAGCFSPSERPHGSDLPVLSFSLHLKHRRPPAPSTWPH